MNAGKDPYFLSDYRINLDGTGLTRLTTGDANHNDVFSEDSTSTSTPGRAWTPPVSVLRQTRDAAY